MTTPGWSEPKATALLVLDDGTVLEGTGVGAAGKAAGEVCFNTAMTGYEEILTDPSYAGQIITFTFPAYRQCRRERRGHRDGERRGDIGATRLRPEDRHHRAGELARQRARLTIG